MPQLYYVLILWDVSDDRNHKSFRLKSNMPFPSPCGTRIHIDCGNSFFAEVAEHMHMQEGAADNGDYHMILVSTDERHFSDDDDGTQIADRFPHLDEHFTDVCESLAENGWERFESIWHPE